MTKSLKSTLTTANPRWLDRALIVNPYCYTLCTTPKRFQKALDYLKIPKNDRPEFMKTAHAHATIHFFDNSDKISKCAIICIKKDKKRAKESIYGFLVHESVHLWQEIKRNIDETAPSLEFEAYSVQAIAQRLMEEYDEQTR